MTCLFAATATSQAMSEHGAKFVHDDRIVLKDDSHSWEGKGKGARFAAHFSAQITSSDLCAAAAKMRPAPSRQQLLPLICGLTRPPG